MLLGLLLAEQTMFFVVRCRQANPDKPYILRLSSWAGNLPKAWLARVEGLSLPKRIRLEQHPSLPT